MLGIHSLVEVVIDALIESYHSKNKIYENVYCDEQLLQQLLEYLETYKKHNVGNIIFLEFDAPKDVILARLAKREQSNTVTDGRIEIAEKQRETAEMPKADLKIITTGSVDNNIEEIIKFLIK